MNTDSSSGSDCCYLTDISARDKPWDEHRANADRVKELYRGTEFDRYAGRIALCSGFLEFGWSVNLETGELGLKLKSAHFCRVRHCPICQWRRSLMWVARFLKALPSIQADYPTARYLFLTLTVKNCELTELRSTITDMQRSWQRLAQRKQFPAIGFARSLEVTRSQDGTAHPHFHALLMVPSGYFHGKGYLTQAQWTELWKDALRADYTPIVNVKAVKPNKNRNNDVTDGDGLTSAIVETFKYSVKEDDLIGNGDNSSKLWLQELTKQLQKTRAIALGGVFKDYLSESEPENLVGEEKETELIEKTSLYFGWREIVKRYAKVFED